MAYGYHYEKIIERKLSNSTWKVLKTERGEYDHNECKRRLDTAVRATRRWFSRSFMTLTDWDDKHMNDYDLQRLRNTLEDMAEYVEVIQRELDRREGVNRQAERIKSLRNIAGRTPEEAAAFLAKAEELEAR